MRTVLVLVLAMFTTSRTAHADAGDRWDGVMIVEQAGAGIGLGAVGGAAFAMIGVKLSEGDNKSMFDGIAGAFVGGSIGLIAGVSIGVKVTGDARGGNGTWGPTVIGTVTGGLLAMVTVPAYAEKLPPYMTVGLFAVTMIVSSIVAYHLSTDDRADDHAKRVMVPLILTTF